MEVVSHLFFYNFSFVMCYNILFTFCHLHMLTMIFINISYDVQYF